MKISLRSGYYYISSRETRQSSKYLKEDKSFAFKLRFSAMFCASFKNYSTSASSIKLISLRSFLISKPGKFLSITYYEYLIN
jgi:hypothetical protein